LVDPEAKAKRLAELEHQGDRITRTILTRLASTFIARLDRDDIFELAKGLDNVTDAIDDVGDMVFLHGITQPLDPVTEQARVHAQLYEFTGEHPAQHMLRWKDVTDGIEHALDELAHVAHTVEGVVLKHA
jgi:uncharacterized protein Yka (UPF0111/DUF47 family)